MADINIGGTLHSTATGNIVVRANEVKDSDLNKKQSDLNEESAYIGEGTGTGDLPEFNPQADTVHVTEQTLSASQKEQARENIDAQKTLQAGVDVKNINGTSILGSGNIVIPKGDSGHNPNLGTYTTSNGTTFTPPLPVTGQAGDYITVINTSGTPTETKYVWNVNTWTNTGIEANAAEFANGQALIDTYIINDLTTGGSGSVLSAEMGKTLESEVSQLDQEVGIVKLSQYNESRLISPIFPKSQFSIVSKLWLSDDENYECVVFGNDSGDITDLHNMTSWGDNKSYTQAVIRNCTYNYCWMFVRNANNTSAAITPSEVYLSGGILEEIQGLTEEVGDLNKAVEVESLTVELGSWSKGTNPYAFTPTTSSNRMRSNKVYNNNGGSVKCICKPGYQCNIFYLNTMTGATYISSWASESNEKKSTTDYQQFVVIFKKADGTDVSSSDLNCLDSFIFVTNDISQSQFDISNLTSEIEEIQQEIGTGYAERPSSGYETFSVQCNTTIADTVEQALSQQDAEVLANDACRIYLPTSYTKGGNPTRLIIHCHGASVNYNYNNFSNLGINAKVLDYLLAKGYAVLLVNGMAGNSTLQIGTTAGSPLAYQSHVKAYKYVLKKYNLCKDGCFVYGISAGSIPALQIANFTDIPVLAQIIYCGIYSVPRAFMLLGGYSEYAKAMKDYIAQQYDFQGTWQESDWSTTDPVSDDEWKHIVDNVMQFAGWNSYLRGATTRMSQEEYADFVGDYFGSSLPSWIDSENISFDTIDQLLMTIKVPQKNTENPTDSLLAAVNAEKTLYDSVSLYRDVPLKIFHATNDSIAPYRYAQYYYNMLKRGGSQVEFRTFPSGGHSPYGNDVSVTIDGVTVNTCVFAIESLLFLHRFE